jgi:hypothetical protein
VKAPGFRECPIDQVRRHAVVDHDEESDIFERVPQLRGDGLPSARPAVEGRTEVDHGNGRTSAEL